METWFPKQMGPFIARNCKFPFLQGKWAQVSCGNMVAWANAPKFQKGM